MGPCLWTGLLTWGGGGGGRVRLWLKTSSKVVTVFIV